MWQALYEELHNEGLTIVAVAMDSRPEAARPWIEAARPDYPCLIDQDHLVADLYNMVNVPQAVWIDEAGRIVRPPEIAGAYESFRWRDADGTVAPELAEKTQRARQVYLDAVRDWVRRGADSEHVFSSEEARAHLSTPSPDVARAHASFRLGQYLLRAGRAGEAQAFLEQAKALHPDSWNIWRQCAEPNEQGLAAGREFWQRVQALGDRRYYPPPDMRGMPD